MVDDLGDTVDQFLTDLFNGVGLMSKFTSRSAIKSQIRRDAAFLHAALADIPIETIRIIVTQTVVSRRSLAEVTPATTSDVE